MPGLRCLLGGNALDVVGLSVSQAPKVIIGEKIVSTQNAERVLLFSSDQFSELAGRPYDGGCFVAVSNGDSLSNEIPVVGVDYTSTRGDINVAFGRAVSGFYRIRYAIFLA